MRMIKFLLRQCMFNRENIIWTAVLLHRGIRNVQTRWRAESLRSWTVKFGGGATAFDWNQRKDPTVRSRRHLSPRMHNYFVPKFILLHWYIRRGKGKNEVSSIEKFDTLFNILLAIIWFPLVKCESQLDDFVQMQRKLNSLF